ncbi:MAG: AzlC family ABC transporter permease [Clostridia bacterium]|nr:AzlC family ABC transporter permease [Clostridia bacterium]
MKTIENNSFSVGLANGIPIGLGYLSVSFAFGLYAVSSGLSVWQAVLISMLNLTSSGQLAAVPIIATVGSIFELIATQLVINLRYALMSISLTQRLGPSVRNSDRLLISFYNTDEVFAVSSARGEMLGRRYFFGLGVASYLGWTLGTLLGAVAGNILPASVVNALGIAIYAMFIAIILPGAKKDKNTLFAILVAIGLSVLFYYTPVLSSVPSGFVIVICAVSVSALFALIAPLKDEEEVAEE